MTELKLALVNNNPTLESALEGAGFEVLEQTYLRPYIDKEGRSKVARTPLFEVFGFDAENFDFEAFEKGEDPGLRLRVRVNLTQTINLLGYEEPFVREDGRQAWGQAFWGIPQGHALYKGAVAFVAAMANFVDEHGAISLGSDDGGETNYAQGARLGHLVETPILLKIDLDEKVTKAGRKFNQINFIEVDATSAKLVYKGMKGESSLCEGKGVYLKEYVNPTVLDSKK